MKLIKFTNRWGNEYTVTFYKSNYANNNRLYIGCMCEDKEYGGYEPYCDVTVNLEQSIPDGNFGFLDTNNGDPNLFDIMYKEGWIDDTGNVGFSGYCVYPVVRFSDEFLKMIESEE